MKQSTKRVTRSTTPKRAVPRKRQSPRTARETATRYQTKTTPRASTRRARWKIPAVTPIGSDAPVSKTLPLAVKRIAKTLQPEKIVLFGSYAYGTPTPDSDVDLLVVMETNQPRIERYLSVSRCLRPRPFAVDIIVKTPNEINSAINQGDFFIEEIYTQGKVLYEPSQ